MVELQLTETSVFAMGSACRIMADVDAAKIEHAVDRLHDLEQRWSRFLPTSEVSLLNDRAGGPPLPVSAVTELLIRQAIDAHRLTDGRFDPLLLRQIEAAGYCTHRRATSAEAPMDPSPRTCGCSSEVVERTAIDLDAIVTTDGIALPSATGFDPGGIGKGLAADLVAEQLVDDGATWVVVSLGGDMRVAGAAVEDHGVNVRIDDPFVDGNLGELTVHGGGVATSSVRKRRWQHDDGEGHHLLDPATGRPSTTKRATVTVHATTGWWADAVASVLTVDDEFGPEMAERFGVQALAVTERGVFEDLRLEHLQPIGHPA